MPTLTCRRCGQDSEALPQPPFRGALGQKIHESICATCWGLWQGEQTKVINELRLSLGDPKAHEVLDRAMKGYLNLNG